MQKKKKGMRGGKGRWISLQTTALGHMIDAALDSNGKIIINIPSVCMQDRNKKKRDLIINTNSTNYTCIIHVCIYR